MSYKQANPKQISEESVSAVFKGWQATAINFCKESILGTWPLDQLKKMENDFNNPLSTDEEKRFHILQSFFSAQIITYVFIDNQKFISENALRIDFSLAQFSKMRRAQAIADCLIPFSDICFGPASKIKKEPKHDAHVRTHALQKVPAPYQRKYPDEPKLLISVEWEKNDGYHIAIKHLVRTGGFCQCVKLFHRETLRAIPLKDIRCISMHLWDNGSYELHIKTAK